MKTSTNTDTTPTYEIVFLPSIKNAVDIQMSMKEDGI
jgi:hypothetical protein